LYLLNNPSLESLAGLASLRARGDFLFVEDHPSLVEFSLPSLESIGGRLRGWNDDAVSFLELHALSGAVTGIELGLNDELLFVDGLLGLSASLGDIVILSNPSLVDLFSLAGLSGPTGAVYVVDNPSLQAIDTLG